MEPKCSRYTTFSNTRITYMTHTGLIDHPEYVLSTQDIC